ncbi:alpha/beta hydrolase [cyanobiont of Ornithocercus magnificus]|nr:alpha/beta hydrolase [cyanobiont of Ornithocercus magnificus]
MNDSTPPLLLIHPIGVGISGKFWDRFISKYREIDSDTVIIAPDLLGCGSQLNIWQASNKQDDSVRKPLTHVEWAKQLIEVMNARIKKPAILVAQGASLPIALEMIRSTPNDILGVVSFGPPAWKVMSEEMNTFTSHLLWRFLFASPLGRILYLWFRRRKFLKSFSIKELFANPNDVDDEWLSMLEKGSRNQSTRWAVFSFLAGSWRKDWRPILTSLKKPTLILIGRNATGISRSGRFDNVKEHMETYSKFMPQAETRMIDGRNVLPYEQVEESVYAVRQWCLSKLC